MRPRFVPTLTVISCLVLAGIVLGDPLGQNTLLPAPPAPSIEAIQARSVERARAHKSLIARMRLQKFIPTPHGEANVEAIGDYEHLRSGDNLLFRVELKNTVTSPQPGGRESKVEQRILTISDGRFSYTLAEQGGQVINASKTLSQPAQTMLADAAFFETLKSLYTLKVMPEEKIDDRDVWVIEARPFKQAPGGPVRTLHYILKDYGVRLKSTDHDEKGRRIQFTGLSDIKFDETIEPRRFIFTPPKGVTVVDLTGG